MPIRLLVPPLTSKPDPRLLRLERVELLGLTWNCKSPPENPSENSSTPPPYEDDNVLPLWVPTPVKAICWVDAGPPVEAGGGGGYAWRWDWAEGVCCEDEDEGVLVL